MSEETKKHKIKLYSTPTCPYCETLKKFFNEKGFEYEEIDVSDNDEAREEMIKKSDQMGVPVLEIDGEVIVGFEKKRIEELLEIKK
ncbi:MAG: glutaredoxin domain-containing protein [bacterium]